jgi:hypothetical protein
LPLTRTMHASGCLLRVRVLSSPDRRSIASLQFDQLPVLLLLLHAVLRALGGESNNVTFLIRLYVSDTARSCACLAFKFLHPQRTKQGSDSAGGANPSNGHCMCACACAFASTPHVLLRLLDSDPQLRKVRYSICYRDIVGATHCPSSGRRFSRQLARIDLLP